MTQEYGQNLVIAFGLALLAALLGGVGYAVHLGSVREDNIRIKCIEVGGTPVKSNGNETVCVRGGR